MKKTLKNRFFFQILEVQNLFYMKQKINKQKLV
jgi:hypothetical protein